MNSLRDQIDEIKSKIKLSDELSKHTKLVNRGNDLWCCCLFHNENPLELKRMHGHLKSAGKGIIKLKETYQGDVTTTARLDNLLDRLKEITSQNFTYSDSDSDSDNA